MASVEKGNRAESRGPTVMGGGLSIAWMGIFGLPLVEVLVTVSTAWAESLILRGVEDRAAGLLSMQCAILSPFVLAMGEGGERS